METVKKTNGHGGARPNSGRKKGQTDRFTIAGLLDAVVVAGGKTYVEALAEDFVHARENDPHLAQKYHNLILNKVAATLTSVEVTDSEDQVEAKRRAFAEALAAMTGVKP